MQFRVWFLAPFIFGTVVTAQDAASLADAQALLEFKSTIWLDPLNIFSTWNIPGGIGSSACSFTGITCDSGGAFRVVSVALEKTRLRGIVSIAVANLTQVVSFDISNNEFMGGVPVAFGSMPSLQFLDLSNNQLSGLVPSDLSWLYNLQTINLANNQLAGGLPAFYSWGLQSIDFSNNTIEGPIPSSYAELANLLVLSLNENLLGDDIPKQLGKYGKLTHVNLSFNTLEGKIPKPLARCPLKFFSVENNSLSGEIPYSTVMKKFAPEAFLGNPLLCGQVIGKKCPGFPLWAKNFLSVFFPLLAAVGLWYFYQWMFPPGDYAKRTIIKITDDFNNSNLIGVGGYCAVYKGVFTSGRVVAVKRLRPEYYGGNVKKFDKERRILINVKHPNIVRVYGTCCTKRLKVLVLQYVPNGTLERKLHQSGSSLHWSSRIDIAAGIAQALAYLHGEWKGKRHPMFWETKASSVLLDDDYNARLTDFRLAKAKPEDNTKTPLSGSIGYTAPGNRTFPGEVYSFGTLLLEIVTGIRPCDADASQGGLPGLVRQAFPRSVRSIFDPQLGDDMRRVEYFDQMTRCTRIGLICTNELAEERPSMQNVLFMFGETYSPPRALLPLPGWLLLALGVAEDTHTERSTWSPWSLVPLPIWLMMLLGFAQENSPQRLPNSMLLA